jgi:hypothetical protein
MGFEYGSSLRFDLNYPVGVTLDLEKKGEFLLTTEKNKEEI